MDQKINPVYEIYKGLKLSVIRKPCSGEIQICLQQGTVKVYLKRAELKEIFTLLEEWRNSHYKSAQINNMWCTQITKDFTNSSDKVIVLEYKLTPCIIFGSDPEAHISIYCKKPEHKVFRRTTFTIWLENGYSIEKFIDMQSIITKKLQEINIINDEIKFAKGIFRDIFYKFDHSQNDEPLEIVRKFMLINHEQKFIDIFNAFITARPPAITKAKELYQYLTTTCIMKNDLVESLKYARFFKCVKPK